jgi:CheY-like chemotaxis protein
MARVADRSILLVEDNEDDAYLITRALRTAEIDSPVHVVTDGEQAMNYLQGTGRYTDRGESSLPQLVVIVLSSSGEVRDINMAYRFGARSYLVKPPTAASFVDLASGLKLYWLQLNQPPQRV